MKRNPFVKNTILLSSRPVMVCFVLMLSLSSWMACSDMLTEDAPQANEADMRPASAAGATLGLHTPTQSQQTSDPPPSYGPFLSPMLIGAEARVFSSFEMAASLQAPLDEVQAVLDAIEPGRFTALPEADEASTALVLVDAPVERILETPSESSVDIQGPFTTFVLSVLAVDNTTERVELATLATYDSDPEIANTLFGSPVSEQADFEWEVEQVAGVNTFRLDIKAEDGFKMKVVAEAPDVLGVRQTFDAFELPVRFLSDGPGSSHPVFFIGLRRDEITVDPADFSVTPGKLKLPEGDLRILDVVEASVFRSREDVVKLE